VGAQRLKSPATLLPAVALALGWLLAVNAKGAVAVVGLGAGCVAVWWASEITGKRGATILLGVLLTGAIAVGKLFTTIPFGPLYITDAVLALLAAWLLTLMLLGRLHDELRLPRGAWPCLIGYVGWGVFAAAYGHAHGGDLYFTARDAVVVAYAPVALFVAILFPTREDVKALLRVLYWAAVGVTFLYLTARFTGWYGPNHALGLEMAFFFIPVLATYTAGGRVRWWEWLLLELQVAIPITLGTRTAWTALAVALVFLMVTAKRRFGVWMTLGFATATFVAVAILAPVKTQPIEQEAASFAARGAPTSDSNAAANASWRTEFWRHDLRAVAHHPVTGVGFGPPADFCFKQNGECWDTRESHDPTQISGPHNGYIDVFYRMGLPGLLLLLGLIWSALRAGRSALPDETARIGIALLLFAAVTAFFSVALEGPYMGVPFWALIGMLWVIGREPPVRSASAG